MAYPYDSGDSHQNPTFVKKYADTLYNIMEEKGGKFRPHVRDVSDKPNAEGIYPRIDARRRMNAVTSTFADTPDNRSSFDQRRITRTDFDDGEMIQDSMDKERALTNPQSEILQSLAYAEGKEEDITILKGALGNAEEREDDAYDGSFTDIALPSGNVIASGSEGLTYEKCVAIQDFFGQNYDLDDPMNSIVIAVSQNQLSDMLVDDKFINSDYTDYYALKKGAVTQFGYMGFNWVKSNLIPYWDEVTISGAYSAVADGSGVLASSIKVTATAHGLTEGDSVTLANTGGYDYDDTYTVQKVTSENIFYVLATYDSTSEGTFTSSSTDSKPILSWGSSRGIPQDTAEQNTRAVVAWIKSGVIFERRGYKADVVVRPDKKNRLQAYVEVSLGATRMEEDKVCVALCDQN